MIFCPCGASTLTRIMKGNKRRRECTKCKRRFSTWEITKEAKDKIKNLLELVEEIIET